MRAKGIRTKDGKNVKILTPRVEVLDPTLLDTMKKFPFNSQNGYDHEHTFVDPQTHKQTVYRDPSLLVQLPPLTTPTNPNLPLALPNVNASTLQPLSSRTTRLKTKGT